MDWGEVLQVPATLNRPNPNILMIVQSAHCHCLVVRPWQKRLRWLLPPTLNKHEIETNAGDVEIRPRGNAQGFPYSYVDHGSTNATLG